MLRVVVYGRGRAGEVVAEFLEEELGVVEVVRVIDYAPAPTNRAEWEERAERNLARFWTRGVTVVLSDYGWASGEIVKRMRKRHPRHQFVRLEVSAGKVRRYCFENCVVAALSTREPCEVWGEELRGRLPKLTWALPDGKSWGRLIDQDLMTQEILARDLRRDFGLAEDEKSGAEDVEGGPEGVMRSSVGRPRSVGRPKSVGVRTHLTLAQTITLEKHRVKLVATLAKLTEFEQSQAKERAAQLAQREPRQPMLVWPSEDTDELARPLRPAVVLLLDPRLWLWRTEIEQIFGWQAQVLDFRKKLFRDTRVALGLLGVDGKAGREANR